MTSDSSVENTPSNVNTSGNSVPARVIGRIPVRNIWLLLLYASDLYRELPTSRSVGVEDDPSELPNLVAELLTRAVERRMRRNLSFDYHRTQAELDRVRGRIDLIKTERRQLLQRGKVACSFEELTVNTPQNQFVRAALSLLPKVVTDQELRRRCRASVIAMDRAGVEEDSATAQRRRPRTPLSRIGPLRVEDREMLAAARLAFDLALPTEEVGPSYLAMPFKEERWMRTLFERAIAGFYDVVLSPQGWRVSYRRRIHWSLDDGSAGVHYVLPSMEMDILLEHPVSEQSQQSRKRIVVDTKFTEILTQGRFEKPTLRSGNLYQMYAYLRSQELTTDLRTLDSTGVLLHPAVGLQFDEFAVIQGHKIRFVTVDLASDSKNIRQQLLRIAD